jgi:hypothetical protein
MHIVDIFIDNYDDVQHVESEICRLLRCSHGKCAAIHTQAYMHFRAMLLSGSSDLSPCKVYLPEGLVAKATSNVVELYWTYALTEVS